MCDSFVWCEQLEQQGKQSSDSKSEELEAEFGAQAVKASDQAYDRSRLDDALIAR